jgi:NAD dependent epimerase/dehydratase
MVADATSLSPARALGSVLVTGAGGFIGSNLVEHLVRGGARVKAFVRYNSRNDFGRLELLDPEVRSEVEIYAGDLVNPEAVFGAVAGCDTVMHLGALIPIPYSYQHPREYVMTNVTGTLNVLEAARRVDVRRLVHVSSSEVYGTAQTVPISESHPLNAQSPYAATKIAADQLALSYWASFELPVVVVRPFNTFGPGQSARAVIPTLITQALSRDIVEIGSLTPTRDFLYVADTAAGMARGATASGVEGQVFNLGTGTEISIGRLAEQIFELVGASPPVVEAAERLRPPGSEVERLVADASKARELLGWEPAVPFEEGLQRTIEWVKLVLPSFKPELYNT